MLRVPQPRRQKKPGIQVRALATGNVRAPDWGALIARAVAVAGLLGLTMTIAVSGIGWLRGGPKIAMVAAGTMIVVCSSES